MKRVVVLAIFCLLFGLVACKGFINDRYIKNHMWLYEGGYHLGDLLLFDSFVDSLLTLRNDTVFKNQVPEAIIINFKKGALNKNAEMTLMSIHSRKLGTYHDKGINYLQKEKNKKTNNVKNKFPEGLVQIEALQLEITEEIEGVQDSELVLSLTLSPLIVDGVELNSVVQFFALSNKNMIKNIYQTGYVFEENEVEPTSIYFESVHVPVELKMLKVTSTEKYNLYEVELYFDFEHEKTTYENITIERSLKLIK